MLATLTTFGAFAAEDQVSTEETAFTAARAQTDPVLRAGAFQDLLRQFPSGTRAHTARQLLLETYLSQLPERVAEIHAVANDQILSAAPGLERWLEETQIADALASAGDNGVDLADARRWAEHAVQAMTEIGYRRESLALQHRYGLPHAAVPQQRREFRHDRASSLAALANVKLRLGDNEGAGTLLSEALHLDPLSAEGFALIGQLAFVRGETRQALEAFVKASALGPLPPRWQARMLSLFTSLEHGGEAELEERVDAAYRSLQPPVFQLPKRQLASDGHPVLLELFTGSDCAPCAAPDLAVDSLLGSYSRHDLIALEYDEHIPRPDPLANADTTERAAFYSAEATPQLFLDGQATPVLGSSRADVENVVVALGEQIESEAALASALQLQLDSSVSADELAVEIHGQARSGVRDSAALGTTGELSLRTLQRAVLYTALVEDDVRYMGRNGVRLHRMVVRGIHQQPASMLLATQAKVARASWRLAELDAAQTAYLERFERQNDRFGAFHFPTTRLPLRMDHLAVVAWVQDPQTKQVLQSAFAPVNVALSTISH